MEFVLPNGSIIRGMATITIDARGVVMCTAEVISKTDITTGEVNGFAPREDRDARRLERALERSSDKSCAAAVRVVKGYRDTERVVIER